MNVEKIGKILMDEFRAKAWLIYMAGADDQRNAALKTKEQFDQEWREKLKKGFRV